MLKNRKKSAYLLLEDRVKEAQEAGLSIDQLEPELYYYLEDRMTGSLVMISVIALTLIFLHLLDHTAAFRTLLFATIWKGIDAWGRPYFQPFINYRLQGKRRA
ncbi:MAG: hypothetical protein FWF59_07130 [Turicibacter sp.]|nr:hypothetical protein [Turicibacter sp.]